MKTVSILVAALILLLIISSTALAQWPSGAQGDQYSAVNGAMQAAAAGAGISPDTFIAIYNDAISGNVSAFSDAEIAAACAVMDSLAPYAATLADYNTVYNNLGCGTSRVAGAAVTRGSLPSTGIAIALLIGSGVFGVGAATRMLKKSRNN